MLSFQQEQNVIIRRKSYAAHLISAYWLVPRLGVLVVKHIRSNMSTKIQWILVLGSHNEQIVITGYCFFTIGLENKIFVLGTEYFNNTCLSTSHTTQKTISGTCKVLLGRFLSKIISLSISSSYSEKVSHHQSQNGILGQSRSIFSLVLLPFGHNITKEHETIQYLQHNQLQGPKMRKMLSKLEK